MSITVTATASGANSNNGIGLAVKVVTGALAAASQPGATAGSSTATTPQLSITPGHAGSWVYGAVVNGGGATAYSSILANTTFSQNTTDATNNVAYGAFRSASGTTTSATTYGAGAPAESANLLYLALAEILASGTLAEDASSPAPVTAAGAKTVTTASFTPPGGSLLVAMATCNTNAGGNALTMAVTGGSLTWTRVAACPTSPYGTLATVWVADVPGGGTAVPLADSGTAADALAAVTATAVPLTDTGSGADALAAVTAAAVALADTGTGADALAVAAVVPPAPPAVLVLPQIIVEAGLVTASPVQPSSVLVLNDPALGLLGTGTLGTGVIWSSISAQVLSFTVTRPSTRLAGPLWNYQPGTASILLDNSDGRFDPDNLSGPYVTGGATQLLPMVPVRIRAVFAGVTYALYSGYADGWMPAQVTYNGGYAELTLPATDAFKVLAGITLPALGSSEGTGAAAGARVKDILTRAGWWTSAEYSAVGPGKSTLQGTALGDTALNLMQIAADSEIGQLYVSGSGAVTFRGRQQILTEGRSSTVQAVFGDLPGTGHPAGTELACAAVGRASDDTTIANDVQATRVGGTLQEVQDAASIAKYLFPRSYARSDLILQNDADTLSWAQWVLYVSKGGEDRFESLAVDPAADPANLWPQVLGREIGDRIQVWTRPAGVASPVSKDCFIAGITHAWDSATSAWLTTWALQDASKYGSFLTLDNATLGQLGSNALAF